MGSNYVGVDLFSPNLTLVTDGDSPSAVIFRIPDERLLDNDVHVRNRVAAVETRATNVESRATSLETRVTSIEGTSGVSALTTTTASITARNVATKTIPANEAVAGTRYKYSGQIQVARGSTATATNISLRMSVGGVIVVLAIDALNTTNGYTGTVRFEGEITFHAAPGASVPFTVTSVINSTVVSATLVTTVPTPDLTLVAATNAPVDIVILAFMSPATAGVSFTPVSGLIHRMKP
jgi:hypothetical protein